MSHVNSCSMSLEEVIELRDKVVRRKYHNPGVPYVPSLLKGPMVDGVRTPIASTSELPDTLVGWCVVSAVDRG